MILIIGKGHYWKEEWLRGIIVTNNFILSDTTLQPITYNKDHFVSLSKNFLGRIVYLLDGRKRRKAFQVDLSSKFISIARLYFDIIK